ncbi:efflux RND transporter periplasmic adaptor subunit [Vibrio sp. SCSIO 43136]|uniref:efflux RND transporter periplasmic adaptor subunit n=1 Tax=Vibrio sp. SCSIO 43136 TaxID=2819101 RepID=UPI0020762DBF|nr:efflux RND transporter periplasmic adaptor subunit [Vibrio sp. SCSIO 43136]USD66303.1 efflux RND transporter periplasmic adaptor subunit [Vibrio sp. SCSIO 43136]
MRCQYLLLTSALVLIAGCSEELPPVPEPDSRPAKIVTVSLSQSSTVRQFPAVSEAGDRAALAFRVPGQLMSVDIHAGQMVEKGTVLASLNPDEYQQLLKQAQANYQLANVQFKRFKKLRADKVVSEQDYDKAVANLNSAKAGLEQAQANLDYTVLKAPYSGTISLVSVENYEFVGAQQAVMNIQTNQVLKVVFQLPEYLLRRFRDDDVAKAQMVFDTVPDRPFPLTFQEIDTEADPKTNAYKVTMAMERPDDVGVLPGMSGKVELEVPKSVASRLPKAAIETEGENSWVWKVDEQGLVRRTPIEVDDNRVLISGLEDGDRIVASGVAVLEEGAKVREWIKERGL